MAKYVVTIYLKGGQKLTLDVEDYSFTTNKDTGEFTAYQFDLPETTQARSIVFVPDQIAGIIAERVPGAEA